jgi:two-component system chemotaxis response regulator CheY
LQVKTAVIVDDEPEITKIYQEILEMQDLKVLGIGQNGNDALRLFKKYKPDVTFLDVHIPSPDGLEVLQEIKKEFPLANVVMITGDVNPDLEIALKKNGAAEVIYKPFNMIKIINMLSKLKIIPISK